MPQKSSLIKTVIISAIGIILLIVVARFFLSPGILGSLKQAVQKKVGGSQTIGQVTIDRGANQIKIEEVPDPSAPNSLAPVIGKTYKITALKPDNQPVHLEFSYDPNQLKKEIPESVLGLYKWYDDGRQKYWARLASQTDTTKHVVSTDLTEFSIIGVRAPLAYYWSESEIEALNSYLNQLLSYVPPYSCGVLMIIEEELLEWKFGELVEAYLRPEEEQVVSQGCVKRPGAPYSVLSDSQGYEREVTWNLPASGQAQRVQYDIQLSVEWQLDDQESAVVNGTVKDQDNKPLEGILISADKQTYYPWQAGTITDDNGHFKISLPSGEYQFIFNPSGLAGEATAEPEAAGQPTGNETKGEKMVKPDKVEILAQGVKVPKPPAKTLPADPKKHKNCQKLTWRETLHEFGDLPHDSSMPITRHGPWNKDITLTCAKYYIDETVKLPINVTVMGMTLVGTETDTISAQQLAPVKSGYGWEGQWQGTHQLKTATELQGGFMDLGPVKVQTPQNTQASQDFYEYTFSLPPKPAPGTPFVISLHRPEGAYQVSAEQAAGVSQYNVMGEGFQMLGPAGSGSHGAKSVDTTYEGKILEVYGEQGALLEFSPAMAGEKIQVKIQKKN